MIWMYAIADRPDLPLPDAQPPLEGLRKGPLVAVYTRDAPSTDTPAPEALWAHERVVEGLMAGRAVLPVRFGTTFRAEDDVRRLLVDHEARFLDLLARVRGRVELGLRVVQHAPVPAPAAVGVAPRTGRDYLYEKVQDGRRAAEVASEIDEPLTRLAVETRRQRPHRHEEVFRASYLVEIAAAARFRTAVERLQAEHPELAILCTGPWPPYSFVGGE